MYSLGLEKSPTNLFPSFKLKKKKNYEYDEIALRINRE